MTGIPLFIWGILGLVGFTSVFSYYIKIKPASKRYYIYSMIFLNLISIVAITSPFVKDPLQKYLFLGGTIGSILWILSIFVIVITYNIKHGNEDWFSE